MESNNPENRVHPDREQLFGNEAFAIGMLQVVSGGTIVSAISQLDKLVKLGGKTPFLVLITLMSFGLLFSVLSAYWRHQYKMWDVKQNHGSATFYLKAMRFSMLAAVILIVLGIVFLVASFWYIEFCV